MKTKIKKFSGGKVKTPVSQSAEPQAKADLGETSCDTGENRKTPQMKPNKQKTPNTRV